MGKEPMSNIERECIPCAAAVENSDQTITDPSTSSALICKLSLQSLAESGHLDISECATPCKYRLIDCTNFVYASELTIREYSEFPTTPYAAVSYVWRGNEPDKELIGPEFSVKGAEDGDPIGLYVLRQACTASLARGATHLWLDRLCIMQTNKMDKKWQIREMYKMYRCCHICVVVPGGIQRLVRLDEDTHWIHRGWTLQEAVAPQSVVVLFSWKLGRCKARAGDTEDIIDEVSPSRSGITPLSLIVDACTVGSMSIEQNDKTRLVEVRLFSSYPSDRSYKDFPFWQPTRRVFSPNVGALARIMAKELDQDMKEYSIWQSALMRTSSRPVDMVFSIMGLFDVTLDPTQFGENDRVRATIALARAILEKGGRANWLGVAFHISPSPHFSTFPEVPLTNVSGKAYVKVSGGLQEVSTLMENEYPIAGALVPMPHATMDADGYVHFSAKAIRLKSCSADAVKAVPDPAKPTHVRAIDASHWMTQEDLDGTDSQGQAFAVLIGFFVGYYPGSTPANDAQNIRAMIIETHAPGRFHVRSYLALGRNTRAWVAKWPECSFCVGGPDRVEAIPENNDNLPIVSVAREQFLNNPRSMLQRPTLEDIAIRRARWASPQKALEQEYL